MPLRPPPNSIAAAWILAFIAALTPTRLSGTAFAAPPPDIGRFSSMTRASSSDREAIRKYADYWCERLGSENAADVSDAEKRLTAAADAPGATLVFRDAYSDAVIPHLETILAEKDPNRQYLQPVNAMKVAASLETEDALKLMVDHCDMLPEKRASVRLWAAIGFRIIFTEADPAQLRKPLPLIRRMGEAAAIEEDPWVLFRQLEAIAAANQNNTLSVLLTTLDAITTRLSQEDQASPLFKAVRPAIVGMREEFLNNRGKAMAIQIAPRLVALLEVAELHWPPDDENLRPGYEETIQQLEQFLQAVDGAVNRTGVITNSTLEKSFREGNREQYRSGLEAIRNELSQPPYK